jgi:hypothetical protein
MSSPEFRLHVWFPLFSNLLKRDSKEPWNAFEIRQNRQVYVQKKKGGGFTSGLSELSVLVIRLKNKVLLLWYYCLVLHCVQCIVCNALIPPLKTKAVIKGKLIWQTRAFRKGYYPTVCNSGGHAVVQLVETLWKVAGSIPDGISNYDNIYRNRILD